MSKALYGAQTGTANIISSSGNGIPVNELRTASSYLGKKSQSFRNQVTWCIKKKKKTLTVKVKAKKKKGIANDIRNFNT